ncbi:hypothetical protein RRG08_034629 [Elysia crispata]|uniref:alkaline phosphatase n=1 Tax=Elysia crispata TaxID=231223 RepID=A0AAE1E9P6_9GAST|nr:hypothetical protein RRG08_034629 [Elysia crispata]
MHKGDSIIPLLTANQAVISCDGFSIFQVLLGGGRSVFLPENVPDPDPDPSFNINLYSRIDGLNLIEEWRKEKANRGFTHSYAYDKAGFDKVDPINTEYLLGLFNQEHMQYEVDRNKTKEPSITDMTAKAIRILRKNPKGFFLFVESGRIDHANHNNWAHKAFAEVEAMNQAVLTAKYLTSDQETLIVVTADHSHVLSIAGYASRGNSITGLNKVTIGKPELLLAKDGMPYTTIIYGNGPGRTTTTRANLTDVDTDAPDYRVDAAVPMSYETHAGEDVAIYATGPQSFLYSGTHEQSYIAMVMAYASCVGPYSDRELCAKHQMEPSQTPCNQRDAAYIARSFPLFTTGIALLTTIFMMHFSQNLDDMVKGKWHNLYDGKKFCFHPWATAETTVSTFTVIRSPTL